MAKGDRCRDTRPGRSARCVSPQLGGYQPCRRQPTLESRIHRKVDVRCAPCGASSHPWRSQEALEGGAWATSLPAVERPTGPEHAGRKARLSEDAVRQAAFDPADMVKARLLEPQSPVVKVCTRRKERLTTGAVLCGGMNRRAPAPSRDGHWLVRPGKGMNGAPTSASDV
jgi:hypothetical protein